MKEYNEYGDRLVGYDVSVKADICGYEDYNPECFTCSMDKKDIFDNWSGVVPDDQLFLCYRPTQSALQKWLREKYKMNVYCEPTELEQYLVRVEMWEKYGGTRDFFATNIEDTYEMALEEGLNTALSIMINEKENEK